MFEECPRCFETEAPLVRVIGHGLICAECLKVMKEVGTL